MQSKGQEQDWFNQMDLDGDGNISYEEFVAANANPIVHDSSLNIVLVTHGLTLRLFLMRWFQFDVDMFEQTTNPPNAAMIVMHHLPGQGFGLTEESRRLLNWSHCT